MIDIKQLKEALEVIEKYIEQEERKQVTKKKLYYALQ